MVLCTAREVLRPADDTPAIAEHVVFPNAVLSASLSGRLTCGKAREGSRFAKRRTEEVIDGSQRMVSQRPR
jgi:hypothetical protein